MKYGHQVALVRFCTPILLTDQLLFLLERPQYTPEVREILSSSSRLSHDVVRISTALGTTLVLYWIKLLDFARQAEARSASVSGRHSQACWFCHILLRWFAPHPPGSHDHQAEKSTDEQGEGRPAET